MDSPIVVQTAEIGYIDHCDVRRTVLKNRTRQERRGRCLVQPDDHRARPLSHTHAKENPGRKWPDALRTKGRPATDVDGARTALEALMRILSGLEDEFLLEE